MARWRSLASDAGILRKKQPEKPEDLLVFGYSCKLFRDDEKALYIDQGKHLISWMGDEKLKIDRYDCRGALSELSSCEASREGYDAMRWLGLNEGERRIEQLCDEERYYSLYTNEEEEELYKEEEQKRLQQKSNEFQYSYEGGEKSVEDEEEGPQLHEQQPVIGVEEKPFAPSPELDVPADIAIPKTTKENARIEKTALFVYRQGGQMEILIKAKQAENPQFGFLNQNNPLYKYYRHILSAIKSGRYQVQSEADAEEKKEEHEQETNEDAYLHPSLLAAGTTTVQTALAVPPPPLPTVPYKPSADCKYSQLVNRIQGAQQQQQQQQQQKQEETVATTITTEHQQINQYYQYYYATQQQYYEYYKQCQARSGGGEVSIENLQAYMLSSMKEQNIDPNLQNQYMAFYTQYAQQQLQQQQQQQHQQQQTNSYAQIVTNVNSVTPQEKKKTDVLSLVQNYGSESDNSSDDDEDVANSEKEEKKILTPPEETRLVIDKMASYVAKNGADFEAIVKSKGDPRFEFLNENHEFFTYYKSKIKEFGEQANKETTAVVVKSKPKKVIAPVSFSIKKPKEDPPKEIKSALPMEESSEDEEKAEPSTTPPPPPPPQPPPPSQPAQQQPSEVKIVEKQAKNGLLDEDDPILEMIDLTDDVEDRKDAKRAEDKIKDKLAAAAREKLRDKALQMERRKKAAAFLKLHSSVEDEKTKVTTPPVSREETTTPPPLPSSRKKHRKESSDVEIEEGEIKKHKNKKKKSHKRKHSNHNKKSKKRRRESSSSS